MYLVKVILLKLYFTNLPWKLCIKHGNAIIKTQTLNS